MIWVMDESACGPTQDAVSIAKNREFFANNEWYKSLQSELELYRFIALSAAHETSGARRLLDVGNGGVFIYPIDHVPHVHAIDIFVEEDFRVRYPKVEWSQMSALDMRFDQPFDTVVAINTLHHVIGSSVRETYANLDTVMRQVAAQLESGGVFVPIGEYGAELVFAAVQDGLPLASEALAIETSADVSVQFSRHPGRRG